MSDYVKQFKRCCLSYWYPRVRKAFPDLRMPETMIVRASVDVQRGLCCHLGGDHISSKVGRALQRFRNRISTTAMRLHEYPLFLRTGHGSGKHDWSRTCFVGAGGSLWARVMALTEWSICVDMLGLPLDVWVLRRLIPTQPAFHAFNGMPIVREFRVFADAKKGALCIHPYWPEDAIENPKPARGWKSKLRALSQIDEETNVVLMHNSANVARVLGGTWSVDWLESAGGEWYLIDMADAAMSFHQEHAD